ncbi:MAG: AAA family ATPase [Myxococcota bacterium]|jgi:predicted ATPase|nr:AAA family ATPase [Myxococcota bacterium]
MIRKLHIKGFRLLRDVTIELEQGVPTVFIGPNASGKSTVIEVLHFLKAAVTSGLGNALTAQRGGLDLVRTRGLARMPLSIEVTLNPSEGFAIEQDRAPLVYGFEVVPSESGQPIVTREWLDKYSHGLTKKPLNLLIRSDSTGPAKLKNVFTTKYDEVQIPSGELAFAVVRHPHYPTFEHLRADFTQLAVFPGFDVRPRWAREGATDDGLSPRERSIIDVADGLDMLGRNIANVLYRMREESPVRFRELSEHFQAEFPFVKSLYFPPIAGGGRIQLAWEDTRFPGDRLYAEQMSDGMLLFLLLLAAASPRTAKPLCLAFDEPDAHLHPSAERRLVHLLEQAAAHQTVIVTTHSSSLLEHLSDPARSIRVCRAGSSGAVQEPLDADRLAAWRDQYSLSDLRLRGHLDLSNQDKEEP